MGIKNIREFVLQTFFTLVVFSIVFYAYLFYNKFDLPGFDTRLLLTILITGIISFFLYFEDILEFIWEFRYYRRTELKFKLKNIFSSIRSKLLNIFRRR